MSSSSPVKRGFCQLSRSRLTEPVLFAAQILDIHNRGCEIIGGTWLLWSIYCSALHLRCEVAPLALGGYQFSVNLAGHER